MKKILFFSLATVIFFAGCKKDKSDAVVSITLNGALSGANIVPPVTTAASGLATATYNRDTKQLSVTVTYTGTAATAIHLHDGAAGVTGPIIGTFTSTTSPATLTVTLNDTQANEVNSGNLYVDIHSAGYSGGEIRGQLIRQ